MASPSPIPFKLRLRQLRDEMGVTQEELAYRTRDAGTPISAQSIRVYESGRSRPDWDPRSGRRGTEVYMALAAGLGVAPEEFIEYRLLKLREALDERLVGLEMALATLDRLQGEAESPPRAGRRPKLPPRQPKSQDNPAPRRRRAAS